MGIAAISRPGIDLPRPMRRFEDLGRIAEIGRGLDDRPGVHGGRRRFEDPGADEDPVATELHHQRRIGRRRDSAGGEIDDRKPSEFLRLEGQFVGDAVGLGETRHLFHGHGRQLADLAVHGPHVAHRLDDVPRPRLALGADHGRPFGHPPQGLAQVPGAADEGDGKAGSCRCGTPHRRG